jgi:hypothetical protein
MQNGMSIKSMGKTFPIRYVTTKDDDANKFCEWHKGVGVIAEVNSVIIVADLSPDKSHEQLLEVCRTMLLRLDLEPVEAVFPCSAMREDLRKAIAEFE